MRKMIDPRWIIDYPEVEKMPFHTEIVEGVDDKVLVGFPAMDYNHFMNVDNFPDLYVSQKSKKQIE
jgi:hypothetical protein